jgi:hypothetical protein
VVVEATMAAAAEVTVAAKAAMVAVAAQDSETATEAAVAKIQGQTIVVPAALPRDTEARPAANPSNLPIVRKKATVKAKLTETTALPKAVSKAVVAAEATETRFTLLRVMLVAKRYHGLQQCLMHQVTLEARHP